MGNAGITVYNSTAYPMNVYLSLGAMHHFCNQLKPQEAFTIYPGPIMYTVGCFLATGTNDITNKQCGTQIALTAPLMLGAIVSLPVDAVGVLIAGAIAIGAITAAGASRITAAFLKVAGQTDWSACIRGIYAGNSHKILLISGGPYIETNAWHSRNIRITQSDASVIPAGTRYRKKNGLYNDDGEYWTDADGEWYPPKNIS